MKKQLRAAEGVLVIVILITLIVCPKLYAAEETLPTPEEIIAKNFETMGGIKALKKIKNKKIFKSNKSVRMNRNLKFTVYQERPDKNFSIEVETARKNKSGSDGKIVWDIYSSGVRLLEGDELSNNL